MFTKQSTQLKRNTGNKGFIAFTVATWAVLMLSVLIALESVWLAVYIDEGVYRKELSYLEEMANRCLEYGYQMHISGEDTDFVWKDGEYSCFGRTGEKLYATTTNSRFWFIKSLNFI